MATLVTQRAVHQSCRYRGVHSPRQRTNRTAIADRLPDAIDCRINKVLRGPGGLGIADVEDKVGKDFPALRRMVHFGMELHRPHLLRRIFNRGDGVRRACHLLKPRCQFYRFIAVRHPHRELRRQVFKQPRARLDLYFRMAVFALAGGAHFSPEGMCHVLQAIADAKNRQAQAEHARIGDRRVFVVYRGRSAGKNQSHGRIAADFLQRRITRQHHGEDLQFTDAARDELRILRAKVEDNNGLSFHE